MQLYDLRREAVMREARAWFISFFPESADDIVRTMIDPETSPKYRMVITYWEMAAGFVNRGAIDEEMFLDASGEALVLFAKVHPYLRELREQLQSLAYLKHLEALVDRLPDGVAILEGHRQRVRRWMDARSEAAAARESAA